MTGCKSSRNTFHTLDVKFHWRHSSAVSIILATWYAIRGHRCQERSDTVRKAFGIYMWACRDVTNGAAAHDTEPWLSGDFVHAAEIVARSSDARCTRIIFELDKISGHMLIGQQWSLAQTGKPIYVSLFVTVTYSSEIIIKYEKFVSEKIIKKNIRFSIKAMKCRSL